MKIAVVDDEIICAECGSYYENLRQTGRFKWNRSDKTMRGRFCLITLNALAECCKLPPKIAEQRDRLRAVAAAIQAQKESEAAVPLVEYPVKADLMVHQIKCANMALLQFGAVKLQEGM